MAKIFKFTFKKNILSMPFFAAALFAIAAGSYETFKHYIDQYGLQVEYIKLFEHNTYLLLPIVIAILPAMLTGKEFSNGTIRNKLTSGTTKAQFFMAHLLVNSIITVIITLLYFLPMFIFFTRYFNVFQPYMVLFSISCMMLGFLLLTAIATVISTMFDKIIISMIASAVLFFGIFFLSSWLGNNLKEPKYLDESIYDEHGRIVDERREVNPFYIENKAERKAMWIAIHIMPFDVIENGAAVLDGQLTSIDKYHETSEESERTKDEIPIFYERNKALFYLPVYSTCMIAAVSALGLFMFKKRNVR